MKVNEAGGLNIQAEKYGKAQQMGASGEMDSESKEVQNQIANAQNRLKELSTNNEMSDEEKKQKRQEIQKKIAELNNELRQHQIQLRREQQAKKEQTEEVTDEKQGKIPGMAEQKESQTVSVSHSGMQAVVSADTAIKQAKAQGSLARTMEGRVRVLQGEIKQDEGRGKNTESKQKELEVLEKKAARMAGAQMGILSDAAQEMKRAVEIDNQKDKKPAGEQKKVSDKMVNVTMGTSSRNKTDIYTRGKTFSTVNIHI